MIREREKQDLYQYRSMPANYSTKINNIKHIISAILKILITSDQYSILHGSVEYINIQYDICNIYWQWLILKTS